MSTADERGRGQHDRQEAVEHEELGRRSLARSFARFDAVLARADALTVRPESSLAGDRTFTPYSSIPDQVRSSIAVSLDHLHAFKIIVKDGGAVLPFAMFTLVRSGYEATGTGLWVLYPPSRDERVLRSLRLAREEARMVKVATEKMERENPAWSRTLAALERDRDAREGIKEADLRNVAKVTERLEDIAHLAPDLFQTPLTLWQTSSGLAHANRAMTVLMLDREQIGDTEHGGADFMMTTSLLVIAGYFDAALALIETLLDLWDQRN